jgi:hypothetical protein
LYDLFITNDALGTGTVTNRWAIYQQQATSKNYFAGRVGIGNTTPATALDVTGVITTSLGSAAAPSLAFTGDSNTGIYSPGADQVAISTNGSNRLQVAADGNIVVGSAVVVNGLRYVDIQNTDTGANTGAIIRLITQDAAGAANTTVDIVKYRNGGFFINNNEPSASGFIGFQQGSVERLRITSTGFVGIGTTTPATALHVNGQITASAGTLAAPSIVFAGDTNTGIYNSAADTINFVTGGVSRVSINVNGTVALASGGLSAREGTAAAPGLRFFNLGGPNGAGFFNPAADVVATSTASVERMRVDANGNVQIGQTSQVLSGLSRFDVVGGRSTFTANDNYSLVLKNGTGGKIAYIGATTAGDVQVSGDGGSAMFTVSQTAGSVGNVGIGTTAPTNLLDVNGTSIRIRTASSPTNAATAGNAGEIRWDSGFLYVCITTGAAGAAVWRRVALSAF